jgi:hypothetical protein
MKPLYLVLAVFLLIIPSVSARLPDDNTTGLWNEYQPGITSNIVQDDISNYFWDGSGSGLVMGKCEFTLSSGQDAYFTLYFLDGSTTNGYIKCEPQLLGLNLLKTCSIGSDTKTATDTLDYFPDHFTMSYYVGNLADEMTYWITVYGDDVLFSNAQVWYQLSGPVSSNPVQKILISSDTGVKQVKIGACPKSNIDALENEFQNINNELQNSWYDWLISQMAGIKTIILLFWRLFEFFIIKNLMLVILMLEGGILAYRFCTARDIFTAIRLIMADNRKLMYGIIDFMRGIVELISYFNPIKWIRGG